MRPEHVSRWRDQLAAAGQTNSTIRRKLTALRSLFSYLQTYGYSGANPAHGKFVAAPAVPRDGKTVGLSAHDCRRLLDAPQGEPAKQTPVDRRDRALLAVLAYSGCRVGELVRLRVRDLQDQRRAPHPQHHRQGRQGTHHAAPPGGGRALGRMAGRARHRDNPTGPLFPAARSARGMGRDGFRPEPMTTRAVEKLIDRYVAALRLDPNVTVHSLRVTALTTARERGSDIIDLQDFAGHADPRTTLTYIRTRDRLSKSPAYVLKY